MLKGAKFDSIDVGTFPNDLQNEFAKFPPDQQDELQKELNELAGQDKPPGLAIPHLALVDGILLFTIGLMGVSLLIGEQLHARLQGIITLIFSLIIVFLAIFLVIKAIALLILMLSLLLSFPFGTLTYMALYGFFNRVAASVALSLLMTLKIGFVICLVLAQQRFLQNMGLVLLILTSFLCTVIISFLHGLVPQFLVSITDAIAAIIVSIVAALWAIFLLVGSIISLIRAIRPPRV